MSDNLSVPIDPAAKPVSAEDLAKNTAEPEMPALKEAQKSGDEVTGLGIVTGIAGA